jgi:hypothetical protein
VARKACRTIKPWRRAPAVRLPEPVLHGRQRARRDLLARAPYPWGSLTCRVGVALEGALRKTAEKRAAMTTGVALAASSPGGVQAGRHRGASALIACIVMALA